MEIHILNVGCGSMALILNPDGTRYVIDCNITDENKAAILKYTQKVFGVGSKVDCFINTHRDADHMRGITDLHAQHPIQEIRDTDVPGTTTDSPDYLAYMRLRRVVSCVVIEPKTYLERGTAKYRFMSGKWAGYTDANEQSAVVKIEYRTPNCSVLFAADSNYRVWKEKIIPAYYEPDLKSGILIAAHHGSLTFFDDPGDTSSYYVEHIKKISPGITLVSVGSNVHGLPDKEAIGLYKQYSQGSAQGDKVFTTEVKGHMKIELRDDGLWVITSG